MKVDVIGSNSLLFANLPPASQVPRRTYRVSDVGPAPGILLTSDGTKYRPAGGRQVLAQRSNNPVTVQALTPGDYAETIGPFPGGLLRSGMQLQATLVADLSGIGTGASYVRFMIGNTLPLNPAYVPVQLLGMQSTVSGMGNSIRGSAVADIRSDTTGNRTSNRLESYSTTYNIIGPYTDLSLNVALPWYVQIHMISAAETATNITSVSWSGGLATFVNTAHTLAAGDKTTVAGVDIGGYNGVLIVNSVPNANTWTAVIADPGAAGTGGTSRRISNAISQSYVLELVG